MTASLTMSAHEPSDVSTNGAWEETSRARGERWLFWYLVLAPLWWAFGVLTVLGVLGLVTLFVLRPPRDPKIRLIVALWFAVAAAQAAAVVVNWGFLREVPFSVLPHRLLNMGVTGWVLLGMAIGVGAEYRLSSALVVRGLCVFGLWILILGLGSYGAAHLIGVDRLSVRSPVGLLLPGGLPAIRNYFTLHFFFSEPIFGKDVVRLILFFPWMNALALAGVTLVLACWADRSHFWRWIGIASGMFAIVTSFSRSAALALLLVIAFMIWWKADRGAKLILVGLVVLAINALALSGLTPDEVVASAFDQFSSARAGSSSARELAYEISWEGFLLSPVVGQGWIGPNYSKEIPIPAGSHSSFYGLLYTGGVLTFTAFVVAFTATVVLAVFRAARNGHGVAALGLLIVLALFAYGENLYSLVPNWLAGFVWLGAGLALNRIGDEASGAAATGAQYGLASTMHRT